MFERKRGIDWIFEGTDQSGEQNRGFIEQIFARG